MSSTRNKSIAITSIAAADTAIEGACYDSTCADDILDSLADEADLLKTAPNRITQTEPIPFLEGGIAESEIPLSPDSNLQNRPVYARTIDPELLNRLTKERQRLDANLEKELYKGKEELTEPSISQARDEKGNFGRKTKYVLGENSFGLNYEEYISSKPIIENRTYIPDALRGRTAAYFATRAGRLTFLRENEEIVLHSPLKFDFREYRLYDKTIRDISLSKDRNKIISGDIMEANKVWRNKKHFSLDSEGYKLFLNYNYGQTFSGEIKSFGQARDLNFDPSIRLNVSFLDAGTIFNSPYSEDEKKSIKFPMNSLVYDIKTDYNFYIRQYENIFNTSIDESQLPNMYCMLYYENLENPPEELARIYTLDDHIKSSEIKGKNFQGQYFDKFARIYNKNNSAALSVKNIYIAPGELAKINEFNSKKVMFPLFADLKFSVDKTRRISNILDETGFLNRFCFKLVEKTVQNEFINVDSYSEAIFDSVGPQGRNNVEQNRDQIKYIDFEELFTEIVDDPEDQLDNPDIISIDDKKEKATIKDSFLRTINSLILKSKMFSIVKEKNRNYRDIVDNRKDCYSETLMYKISKFKGNQESDQPIQNIFLINEPFLDVINYVDTQLKYDQEYHYKIYAYEVIIASEYQYVQETVATTSLNFTTLTKPKIIVAQIPFLEKTVRVYDSSPPPPEVNIEYYKGKDNKLLLMFNSSVNTYKAKPTIVRASDVPIFDKVSKKQNVQFGDPLEFSSDDKISSYEIFRMTKKPTSYSDFSIRFLQNVSTGNASSASFVDTIRPNTKYYYMFRAVDVHGKPSNPTEVFEVEIINENGTIFVLKKSFIPQKEIKKDQSRGFKRFVKIQPSMQQVILNEEYEKYSKSKNINEAIQNTNLGLTKPAVWGKKFKVRLVSKQSKKVLDFNIKFDIKKEYLNNTGK